jgi:hypothetical protein
VEKSRPFPKVVLIPIGMLPLGLAGAVALAACGHPATRAECEAIVDKSAELAIREEHKITDPKIIEERVAAVRESRGEELIKKCIGRRMTKNALACVRAAQDDAAVESCFY